LNIRPDGQGHEKFIVKLIVDGRKLEKAPGSPLSEAIGISYYEDGDDDASEDFDGSHFWQSTYESSTPRKVCLNSRITEERF